MDVSEFRSPYAQRLRAEGFAMGYAKRTGKSYDEGFAVAVLWLLSERGLEVPEEVRMRIESCTDSDTVYLWAYRASVVKKAEDLFAED